jgi:hypothetical protein
MKTNENRDFNCKKEELPIVCRFNLFSLKRDHNDFVTYSPTFGDEFVAGYEKMIEDVIELVQPKSEIAAQKVITDRLHTTINSLIAPINHLTGYVNMSNEKLKITPESYGLSALRASIHSLDPEGVMQNLNLVIGNNKKYAEVLAEKGFKPELAARFTDAASSIAADKQAQYEMISNRKLIVQNNMGLLNTLNGTLTQVLSIGKILYADSDPVKAKEYTFTQLLKLVRRASKAENGNTNDKNTTTGTESK